MNGTKKVVLDIAPLGDIMMMSAVSQALKRIGYQPTIRVPEFAFRLASMLGVNVMKISDHSEGAIELTMGDYLNYDTHFAPLPDTGFRSKLDFRRSNAEGALLGHLCQWMGVHAAVLLGNEPFPVNPGKVRIPLSRNQMDEGKQLLRSQVGGKKPIVLLSVGAGSQNRILPPQVILEVIGLLGDEFQVALLTPLPNVPGFSDIPVPNVQCDLEELPALLVGADVVVSTDSGPYHIAAGAIQGSGVNPQKLILAVGSSNPLALIYERNQYVQAPREACPVLPCGRHGYGDTVPQRLKGHEFYEVKKSLCIFEEYKETGLAPCMRAVSAEEIVARVREAV